MHQLKDSKPPAEFPHHLECQQYQQTDCDRKERMFSQWIQGCVFRLVVKCHDVVPCVAQKFEQEGQHPVSPTARPLLILSQQQKPRIRCILERLSNQV